MGSPTLTALGLSGLEAVLTVVTAVGIYVVVIVLSRLRGQRQFSTTSTYDLAFIFAIGSVMGRVVLVRVSLLAAVVGLSTLFALHALTTELHHRFPRVHRLLENAPLLLIAGGDVIEGNLRRGAVSRFELHEALRIAGHGSVRSVGAAVLERNGDISVIPADAPVDAAVFDQVEGAGHLRDGRRGTG